MIHLDGIFVCLALPLFIAMLLTRGKAKRFIGFSVVGLVVCLLSAYVNSAIAASAANNGYASLTTEKAMVQITPIVEEAMKALPILFFAVVFAPGRRSLLGCAVAVGLGFAVLENAVYIARHIDLGFPFALMRGLSAGVTHVVCAAFFGHGLSHVGRLKLPLAPCAFALLCATSTFHAIYNLLASTQGLLRSVGHALPALMAAMLIAAWGAKEA